MHLQRLRGGHQNGELWRDARLSAFNVEELFCTQVGTEPRLGDGVVAKGHGHFGSHHAVTAVSDVGKGTAVDKGRRVLDGLNHIGMDGIVQDGHDCAAHPQVFNREGFAL